MNIYHLSPRLSRMTIENDTGEEKRNSNGTHSESSTS